MSNVYWMVPAASRAMWFIVPVIALLLGVIALMLVVGLGTQRSRFEVSEQSLRLRGDIWGRTIPIASLDLEAARVLDLRGEPSLQPVSRRMGTGLPGFAAGWFRLRNGDRALLYLSDRTRVLHVPTTDGYSLLLSPREPETMLEDLRSRR